MLSTFAFEVREGLFGKNNDKYSPGLCGRWTSETRGVWCGPAQVLASRADLPRVWFFVLL